MQLYCIVRFTLIINIGGPNAWSVRSYNLCHQTIPCQFGTTFDMTSKQLWAWFLGRIIHQIYDHTISESFSKVTFLWELQLLKNSSDTYQHKQQKEWLQSHWRQSDMIDHIPYTLWHGLGVVTEGYSWITYRGKASLFTTQNWRFGINLCSDFQLIIDHLSNVNITFQSFYNNTLTFNELWPLCHRAIISHMIYML